MTLEGREKRWRWSLDVLFDVDVWISFLQIALVSRSVDELVEIRQHVLVGAEIDLDEL